jgi:hypothetical protein
MSSLLLIIFSAALGIINSEQRMSKRTTDRETIFSIAEAGINYYRWHLAHAPLDYVDGSTVTLSSTVPSDYTTDYLTAGEQYYGDAADTITTAPASLDNQLWLKTQQDDVNNSATDFITFTVNRPIYVYVGYDNRGTPPTWLSSAFTNTGETVVVSDAGASPLRVWRKQFSAGSVTLGGNHAPGSSGALSMYTVTLVPTSATGPFIHDYEDFDGTVIGQYSLTVTPPSLGSTITTVSSTSWLLSEPNRKRTIVARFGVPSFSQYAVVADDVMRFGTGTETFGKIHSNYGIRFDGLAHGLITSSCPSYVDPDHGGAPEYCVHTHDAPVDPLPPAPLPARLDVFAGGRQLPVAPVDFTGITGDLATLKVSGQDPNGAYLGPSGTEGYHIVLKTNGRMDMYKVNTQSFCRYKPGSTWFSYSNIFSIATQSTFTYKGGSSLNVPLPTNGVIFAEDNVWVNGQINGAKVSVVAAREPLASGTASIIVNSDLLYTNYDGTDVIGLIAQQDISVGFYSEDNLEIDAAVIAQKGRAGRYYYQDYDLSSNRYNPANCGGNLPAGYIHRTTLTLHGSIATHSRYGFAYTDGTGYINRNLIFDDHLIFGPPPSFPTTGEYVMISWEEQ